MALPTATNNFTAADYTNLTSTTYGSSWTVDEGVLKVVGNAIASYSGASNHTAHWNADTFDTEQYAQGVAKRGPTASSPFGLAINVSGSGATLQGYRFAWPSTTDPDSFLSKCTSGSWSNKIPDGEADIYLTPSPSDGDTVKLTHEISGGTHYIKVYYNGVLKFTYTDASPLTGGSAGVSGGSWSGDAYSRVDDWVGGNVNASSTPIAALSGNHARRRRA